VLRGYSRVAIFKKKKKKTGYAINEHQDPLRMRSMKERNQKT